MSLTEYEYTTTLVSSSPFPSVGLFVIRLGGLSWSFGFGTRYKTTQRTLCLYDNYNYRRNKQIIDQLMLPELERLNTNSLQPSSSFDSFSARLGGLNLFCVPEYVTICYMFIYTLTIKNIILMTLTFG